MTNENVIPMDLFPPVLRRQVNETLFGRQIQLRNNTSDSEEEYEQEDFPDSESEEEEESHVCTDPNNCMHCG